MFLPSRFKSKSFLTRFLGMLIGNLILALGSACFNLSNMGMHPFNSFVMAISPRVGIDFGTLLALVGGLLLIIQIIWGRKTIGLGTVVNFVGLGYIILFWSQLLMKLLPFYEKPQCRYLLLLVGVICISFGLSLYQTADMGIAPFDAMSLILDQHTPVPYFWCRLFTDALAAVATFLAGGILGLGSILCVFCLAPFITFFNRTFSEKLLRS